MTGFAAVWFRRGSEKFRRPLRLPRHGHKHLKSFKILERAKGFEPSTPTLASLDRVHGRPIRKEPHPQRRCLRRIHSAATLTPLYYPATIHPCLRFGQPGATRRRALTWCLPRWPRRRISRPEQGHDWWSARRGRSISRNSAQYCRPLLAPLTKKCDL